MLNIALFLMTVTSFTGFEKNFERNLMFYRLYLGNDQELNHLGYLHLKGLKYLIDLKLGDYRAINQDVVDIFELIDQDDYLYDEFFKKYTAELPH